MGDTTKPKPNDDDPNRKRPLVIPWIQALGLFVVAGLALADLWDHEEEVPLAVYGAILTMVFGIGPETFTSVFKKG